MNSSELDLKSAMSAIVTNAANLIIIDCLSLLTMALFRATLDKLLVDTTKPICCDHSETMLLLSCPFFFPRENRITQPIPVTIRKDRKRILV